jgi:hypothetical protein
MSPFSKRNLYLQGSFSYLKKKIKSISVVRNWKIVGPGHMTSCMWDRVERNPSKMCVL